MTTGRRGFWLALLWCWLLPVSGGGGGGDDPAALALLHKSTALLRGGGSEGHYRVTIERPDWRRELRLRSIDDPGNDRARLELLAPRKVQGTVFFKRGDQLAMYLPKLRRELHISPAMLQDPWMGSDFTNQDLLAAGALIGQYRHRVLAREDGVVVIESSPRPETPVTWIRLEQRLREADGLPLAIQYFGAAGSGDRVLRFSAPRTFSGRTVPSRWVMQPLARPDQHTRIEVEELRFGIRPEDALFLPGQASPGPP